MAGDSFGYFSAEILQINLFLGLWNRCNRANVGKANDIFQLAL